MKVCKLCFQGAHCFGHHETRCECACKELPQTEPSVATREEWVLIQARQADIRQQMREVEGKPAQV